MQLFVCFFACFRLTVSRRVLLWGLVLGSGSNGHGDRDVGGVLRLELGLSYVPEPRTRMSRNLTLGSSGLCEESVHWE